MRIPHKSTPIPYRIGVFLPSARTALLAAAAALILVETATATSVFGTSYTGTVANLPDSDSASLAFDGLPETVGTSGLIVSETATMIGGVELVEFTLTTGDGEPFVGQQNDPAATSNVEITDLHGFGDPTPMQALERSGFLVLTIDGTPQLMSDLGGHGLTFVPHPLDSQLQVLLIENETTSITMGTLGVSTFEVFSALVGSTDAALIDGVRLGVTIGVPEPDPALAIPALVALLIVLARHRNRNGSDGARA
jgi:hypothetical protein